MLFFLKENSAFFFLNVVFLKSREFSTAGEQSRIKLKEIYISSLNIRFMTKNFMC